MLWGEYLPKSTKGPCAPFFLLVIASRCFENLWRVLDRPAAQGGWLGIEEKARGSLGRKETDPLSCFVVVVHQGP